VDGIEDFWPNYIETPPAKIRGMSLERLHFYHDYFSEIRLELRGRAEKYMDSAANRLDLLEKELSRRHGDLRDRKTRTLAWIAIGVSLLSALGTVGQWLAYRQFAMPPPLQTNAQMSTTESPQMKPSATTPAANAAASATSTPEKAATPPPEQPPL
jgi:hypothetical protein